MKNASRTVENTIEIKKDPDRHTPDNKSQDKIRTSDRPRSPEHDFPENPDKNVTRTGHGQGCPPTSGYDKIIKFGETVSLKIEGNRTVSLKIAELVYM